MQPRPTNHRRKRWLVVALAGTVAALAALPVAAKAALIPCPVSLCVPVPTPNPIVTLPLRPTPNPTLPPAPTPSPVVPPGPVPGPLPVPVTPEANLQAIGRWVMSGGNWSVCQIPAQVGLKVDPTKCPPDAGVTVTVPQAKDWFAPLYARMIEIAGLLMLPFLLLAFLQSLLRGDVAMALRATFVKVPLAVILSAIAVSVVQTLLAVSDSFSDYMLAGYQGQVTAGIGSLAGVMAAVAAGGSATIVGMSAAGVIAALVATMAALAILVELLARQALLYAGVLFLPVGFAAMVWPQLLRWAQRLVEVVITAIFAKFVIVSILVLGAAAFTSPAGGGPFDSQAPAGSTLIVGMLLVGLAALSPIALLWALPTFESAVLAQFHGSASGPVTSFPHTVERSVYHLGMRHMWRERGRQAGRGPGAGGQVLLVQPGSAVIVRPPRNPQGPTPGGRPPGPPPNTPGGPTPRGGRPPRNPQGGSTPGTGRRYPSPPGTRPMAPMRRS